MLGGRTQATILKLFKPILLKIRAARVSSTLEHLWFQAFLANLATRLTPLLQWLLAGYQAISSFTAE
jgi:hypothetical protein